VVATLVIAGLLVALVVLLFAAKSTLAKVAADQLPISWEQKFGDAVFESVKSQDKIVNDPQWTEQLTAVTSRLLQSITNADYKFQFHVVEAPELNAFAIPGGHVVVHTGLLKAVER